MNYTKQIQDIAAKLFAEGKIDVFVGYRMNGFDDNQVPILITDPQDVSKLVFTDKSVFNLVNYLKTDHTRRKRVGLVVKGCDSRSLNLMLTESQVKRKNLYVVGICCEGVVDDAGQKMQNCTECVVPDAVVYDELIGTPAGQKPYTINVDIAALASKPLTERSFVPAMLLRQMLHRPGDCYVIQWRKYHLSGIPCPDDLVASPGRPVCRLPQLRKGLSKPSAIASAAQAE